MGEETYQVKLFIDDQRVPETEEWNVVRSFDEFKQYIEDYGVPDVISFDHDLQPEHTTLTYKYSYNDLQKMYREMTPKCGYHCAEFLIGYCDTFGVELPQCIIHSSNNIGRSNLYNLLTAAFLNQGKPANILVETLA